MHINGATYSVIPDFPNYGVTLEGKVFNLNTGREMSLSPTMHGELTVGLVNDGIQYRRSVKVLVAEAFVDGRTHIFDTPIQLDGDRRNLHADNIRWRPRWFAWKYIRQLSEEPPSWFYIGPIMDVITRIEYKTIIEAAVTNGSLCTDIRHSIINETRVYPLGEQYINV